MKKSASAIIVSLVMLGTVVSFFNIQFGRAYPNKVYVDDDNISGPWDGTQQHPYQNITSGLEQASANDTIFVYNGTYVENVRVNKSVSLVGENTHGTIIDGNFTDKVVIITADNVNIASFTIRNAEDFHGHGVSVEYSRNCNISYNVITNNLEGIRLTASNSNTIANNQVFCLPDWLGVKLASSNDNILTNNTVSFGYMAIILAGSDYNILNGNDLYSNTFGIRLADSKNNTIVTNKISNNVRGIHIASYNRPGLANVIYHNNLINNTKQATEHNSTNIWYNDYPSGGNYWSDYNGTDHYSGPYQNETGSDGIGDTPYLIPYLNSSDEYPLMKPYGVLHEIGITNTLTSKTIVGQGYSLQIDIMSVNYGVYTETFNVTVYANTTVIDRAEVTLTAENLTVITFTWNTSGFAKGNYTITTIADPVAGEWDTDDNTYTSIIKITVPGDLDGDFDVDLYDAVKLLKCYGAKEDDPDYDLNLDINGNGQIFLYDAVILLSHYGQKDP